jgi:hypothetical protein
LNLPGEDLVADDESGRGAGHRAMIQRSGLERTRPAERLSRLAAELSILSIGAAKTRMTAKHRSPFFLLVLLLAVVAVAALRPVAIVAQPAASAADPYALDRPLPIDDAVRTGRLDNGLRYYVRSNPKPEKRAELRLLVDVGSIVEDDSQRGLAHFVEHMAFNGTRRFARQELVDYLEGRSSSVGSRSSRTGPAASPSRARRSTRSAAS